MKIIFELEKCSGCGSCAALCHKKWELKEDGKSQLLGSKKNSETNNFEKEITEKNCNQEASDSCPVQIIHIEK
ncbi:MAG: ferredoxin [Candidatus Nealsonbacteria bacterium]